MNSREQKNLNAFHKEAAAQEEGDGRLLLRLWPFLRPSKGWFTLALSAVLVTSALSLSRPLIMQWAIDGSVTGGDPDAIFWGGALFAAVAITEQILSFVQIYSTQIVGARAMSDLRRHVFQFLGRLPLRFFDRQPVGRLVTRVTNDIDSILELFNSGAVGAVGDLLRLVGVVGLMLTLDIKLSLVAFASLPFILVLMIWVRRRARDAFRTIRGESARMNATMNEQVNGLSLIQAYGRQETTFAQFDEINSAYRDANVRSIKYDAIQDAAIDAVSSVAVASIIVALGYEGATYGTIVALTAYLAQFFEPIGMLAQRFTLMQSALSGAERVFSLLDVTERDAAAGPESGQASASPGGVETLDPSGKPWAVELEDVSFAYKEGHDVLRHISLKAAQGETIALVGPTGSGKTTITALLLRLYEHREGLVKVLGRDVMRMNRSELRRQFAVVPQDVFLFSGTLAQNVAAGEEVDLARVGQVLSQMGVADLFLSRVGGIECEVRSGGANFSAGERQLIAFARALYRDAPLLILDEATASVDSDTEARMQKALSVLVKGRTSLIVAHRLSTIRAADRIVVLQQGRVLEQGNHEELLEADGLYAALHRLQFSRREAAEEAAAS